MSRASPLYVSKVTTLLAAAKGEWSKVYAAVMQCTAISSSALAAEVVPQFPFQIRHRFHALWCGLGYMKPLLGSTRRRSSEVATLGMKKRNCIMIPEVDYASLAPCQLALRSSPPARPGIGSPTGKSKAITT